MSTRVTVAVLVSAGRHPVSAVARACHGDAVAMALGRKLVGDGLRVIHAGRPGDPALPDYLALGARTVDVLSVGPGVDPIFALAEQLHDTSLILTGSRAEQGLGSGLLPYLLAHTLNRPLMADVLDVQIDQGTAIVRQFMPKGQRRTLMGPIPLVLAVHPRAPVELNYAHARRLAGRINTVGTIAPADHGLGASWTVDIEPRQPVRLKAKENLDGHARMLACVQSPAKGGAVAFDGSPVDKAQILLTYLRDHRLINF